MGGKAWSVRQVVGGNGDSSVSILIWRLIRAHWPHPWQPFGHWRELLKDNMVIAIAARDIITSAIMFGRDSS